MKEFKVGDKVRIKTLKVPGRGTLSGIVGHEAEIESISTLSGEKWHRLYPYVIGGDFPAECLELIERKPSKTLFDIDDL